MAKNPNYAKITGPPSLGGFHSPTPVQKMSSHSSSVPFQPASLDIWDKKYRLKDHKGNPVDQDIQDTYERVATALADIETTEEKRKYWKGRFLEAMRRGAIPAGRITSNAGAGHYKPATSLINCTVSGHINDSMDDIMAKAHEAALTLKAGCVAPGTWVVTEKGLVTADQAVQEKHESILSYNVESRIFEMRKIEKHMTTHVSNKDNIKIQAGGVELTTSNVHPVLVYKNGSLQYAAAGDIKVGDAIVQKCFAWEADASRANEAWFAGAHLGDGSAYYKKPHDYKPSRRVFKEKAEALGLRLVFKIRAAEREVVERYASFFESFCESKAQVVPTATPNGTPVWDYCVSSYGANKAIDLVDGIVGSKCDRISVPEWIATNPDKFFIPFLAGLLDTDGTVSRERGSASLFTANIDFAKQLKAILGLFGVHGALTETAPRDHEHKGVLIKGKGGAQLKISDSSFLAVVANYMADSGKKSIIQKHATTSGQYEHFVMTPQLKAALLEKFEGLTHTERQELGFYHGYHTRDIVSRVWLDKWSKRFEALERLISFVRTLRPVVSIETGLDISETFFDFRVEGNNNYLAGNNGLMVIHNCGIGYSFSTLRPRGAYVAGAGAHTSGPTSFMDIYDKMCFTVASAGGRRGAQMGTFDVGHPDVRDFIKVKREDGRLRQFNLSLLITDDFMKAVESNGNWALVFPVHPKEAADLDMDDPNQVVWREWPINDKYITREDGMVACKVYEVIPARRLWDMIMSSTYDFAEPGFILIDKVNEMNNNWWCENIQATNPCVTGDTMILTDKGEVRIDSVVGQKVRVWNGEEFSEVEVRVTGENLPVLSLSFSNGSGLSCTLYHGFYLADGRKIEAKDLNVGDQLEAFSIPGQGEQVLTTVTKIEALEGVAEKVYCFTEPKRHRGCFNGIVTANCGEQPLPEYGSCWTADMRLMTNHGLIRTDEAFERAQRGEPLMVAVDDIFSKEGTSLRPCEIVVRGKKAVLEIQLKNGQKIELTEDHRVYTPNGWVEAGKLTVGDRIHAQSKAISGLRLAPNQYLGFLKYFVDKHVDNGELIITKSIHQTALRPVLAALAINHSVTGKGGLRLSAYHPMVLEARRLSWSQLGQEGAVGRAIAAQACCANYKGKCANYVDSEEIARDLAKSLEEAAGITSTVSHHGKGRWRVVYQQADLPALPQLVESNLDLESAVYGWLLTDGWLTNSAGVLFNTQDDIAQDLIGGAFALMTGTNGKIRTAYEGQTTNVNTLGCWKACAIEKLRSAMGLDSYKSKDIQVPENIFHASLEAQASFLSAVFCADGSVDQNGKHIRLTTASKKFAQDVQLMLLSFGIHSNISEGISKGNIFYVVNVRERDSYAFFRHIGFRFNSSKQAKLRSRMENKRHWQQMEEHIVEEVAAIRPIGEHVVYDIEEFSTNTLVVNGLVVHNCLLGSINLTKFVIDPFTDKARFDWEAYKETVRVFTRMLDNVVEINGLPLERQREEILTKRRHGMGFLGLGSALTMMRVPYGSPKSLEFTEEVSKVMALEGWRVALELSKEKGPAPVLAQEYEVTAEMLRKRPEMVRDGWKVGQKIRGSVLHATYSRYMQHVAEADPELVRELAEVGARFTHHTSIAPTGTISLSLANNASNGIEPSFAHHYSRNVIREGKKSKEKVDVFSFELLAYRHLVNSKAMPFSEDPEAKLPEYFVSADDITPKQHVDVQAAAQKWIDSAISKTANVPTDYPYEDFKDIYLYAYQKGLKGCTTFRFNPEAFQGVLVKETDLENTKYRFTLEDGTEVELRGNEEVEYDGEVHTAANLFDALKEGYYGKF